jgi:hypothetical protein
MKATNRYLLIALIFISFFSCTDENSPAGECDLKLSICTEEFRSITLEIEDFDGNPVILENFYTFLDSRKKFDFELDDFQLESGTYPVITDSELEELDREGTVLIFVGEIDGKNIVEHQILIGHDCCHAQLIEGDDKILIEQ